MTGKYYSLLTFGLLSILAFSIIVNPIDASKSHGTPLSTINSKQVCGDSLCSTLMSISEKIDIFFENNLKSDDSMEYDDTMVFQQAIPSSTQVISAESGISKSNFMSDMNKFLKISKIISMENKEIGFDILKSKKSFSSVSSPISQIPEMKKFPSIKSQMDLSNTSQKEMMLSKISIFNLDKKITIDAKNLKIKLKDSSENNLDNSKNQVDSKYLKIIEKLKDKKITVEKVN